MANQSSSQSSDKSDQSSSQSSNQTSNQSGKNNSKSNSRSRPQRKGRRPNIPTSPQAVKARVIRLSFANIAILIGGVFALLFLFNSAAQPTLGDEVSIDRFLGNLGDNNYERVEIRNDGNAVGYGKSFAVTELGEGEDTNLEEELGGDSFTGGDELELKSYSDLIAEFEEPESFAEIVEDLRSGLNLNQAQIGQIIVAEDSVIVDWSGNTRRDWVIANTGEEEFRAELREANLDADALNVPVVYLRRAARVVELNTLEQATTNGRFTAAWEYAGRIYAQVESTQLEQTYVNYGTFKFDDFPKFLQDEGFSLASENVEFTVQPINQIDFITIINLIFIAMLGVLAFMLLRSMNGAGGGGLMRFGQSKARMFFGKKMNINFDDVAGVDEAKEELREVVDFLKHPKKYMKMGAKIPRGILMIGEPGTGKTLMARAIAGEAGVPFFHTSGSEFEEMLVGAGASRVRDLFDKAKKAAPALIFIDEIDAVGRKRGTTVQSSSTEQTLNQILVEMDGFENRDNVIVIAATNRPDVLDPALLRPGRFDRKVVLDQPDIEGRKAILMIHAEGKPLAEEVDFEKVAKRTVGFSGADLANMLNEAAIIVAKENRKEINMADIEEAATKVQTGPIRKRKRSDEELKMTAYHEAAHAIVMKLTPQSDPVHRITILSRGMALGYTMPLPQSDELQMTKTKMESKIRSLLAGFISEEMVFQEVTTGASNDIEKATNIARKMVKRFGMSKELGLVKYGRSETDSWSQEQNDYSEATAEMIDKEVRKIIQQGYEEAKKLLEENREVLDKIAADLLEREVIEADEFQGYFAADQEK